MSTIQIDPLDLFMESIVENYRAQIDAIKAERKVLDNTEITEID